jgi:hypothetical protein
MNRVIFAIVLSVACVGCGSESPSGPSNSGGSGNNPSNGSMRATINGTAWNATTIVVNRIPPSGSFGGTLTILGTNAALRSIMLTVTPTGPGTYNFAPRSATNMAVADSNAQGWYASDEYAGSTGSTNFTTQTTNRVAGSFSFLAVPATATGATGTLNVTSGTFDVSY